jgi:ATP-dependent DNA helicase RecG
MVETTDGFKISEVDMKLRGPGEFFGTKQSGELKFNAADITKDMVLIEGARKSAFKLAEEDIQLRKDENKMIREHFLTNYKDSMSLIRIA